MFQRLRDEASEIKKTCIKLDNDISQAKRTLLTKADDTDLQKTRKLFDDYATIKDVKKLGASVLPKI